MIDISKAGTFKLGDRIVKRMGYGAMQLAGPGVFGPPKDRAGAIAVLREAVASGVNHIDTSDYYGPYVTNQLIREALHPYPADLVIVTKIGARRGEDASWIPAMAPAELKSAVHDNLSRLGLDAIEVVNLRIMGEVHGPAEGSIEAPLTVLAELQRQGLVRHIGLSNVTSKQVSQGRRICDIVCVQNMYNVAHREDDALIDELARAGRPTRRSSRSAASRRCNQPRLATPRRASAPPRCKWRSPGSFAARPTSCSFPGLRRPVICAKTWRRRAWSCRPRRPLRWIGSGPGSRRPEGQVRSITLAAVVPVGGRERNGHAGRRSASHRDDDKKDKKILHCPPTTQPRRFLDARAQTAASPSPVEQNAM